MDFQDINSYLSKVKDIFYQKSSLEFPQPKEMNWLSADELYDCLTGLFGDKVSIISPNISSISNIFSPNWKEGTINIMENLWELFLHEVNFSSFFNIC